MYVAIYTDDCKKWSPLIINYTGKWIAMTVAFALQSRISAIQSAAMGGQIFARSLLDLGRERGMITLNAEETYMDEVIGWTVAVIGAPSDPSEPARQTHPCIHSLHHAPAVGFCHPVSLAPMIVSVAYGLPPRSAWLRGCVAACLCLRLPCPAGIWSQLSSGMQLRFPLNVMLFPLSLTEGILRWLVVAAPGSVSGALSNRAHSVLLPAAKHHLRACLLFVLFVLHL